MPRPQFPHKCAPGGTRTPNRPGRNRLLYPLSYERLGPILPKRHEPHQLGMGRPHSLLVPGRLLGRDVGGPLDELEVIVGVSRRDKP